MTVLQAALPWVSDALVVLGVFVVTIGIYGMVRLPDTYTKAHGASKAVFLGVIVLLLASSLTGDLDIILRVALISFFLLVTTPVSAHVVGRAAYFRGERMRSPHPLDESGRGLDRPGPGDDMAPR